MEPNLKTLAETKRRTLEAGLVTVEQLMAWADDRIAQLDQPPYWLIAVSMARSKQEVVDALRAVGGTAETSTVWEGVARDLLETFDRDPERDSDVGKYLYFLGMNEEAPTLGTKGELMSFWDPIDLARDGAYGDLAAERLRLRAFLALRSVARQRP